MLGSINKMYQQFVRYLNYNLFLSFQARVIVDLKKTDAQGNPVSRGFGFVSFTEHEHALKALMELNNNPNIFTPQAVLYFNLFSVFEDKLLFIN